MISNFFINLLLLISAILIGGHSLKEKPLNEESSLVFKIMLGLGGGLLGIGMVIYTITITGTVIIIDLRVVPLMIIYFIGGLIPALITGFVELVFRIFYYGMNHSAAVGILQIILMFPMYLIIDKFKLRRKRKWKIMVLSTMVILISTAYYLLYNIKNGIYVLLIYAAFYVIAFILTFYLLQYVDSANRLYRRYKYESTKDYLTGLNNSRQFDIIFNRKIAEAIEKQENISCLMIDIDHFKKVNDTYGHAAGDIVLKELTAIIKRVCGEANDVSRVGGEEFCALLSNCSLNEAEVVAHIICDNIRKNRFSIGKTNINVTVSVGVAAFPETVDSTDNLKEQADQALYKAKQTGRDRVCSIL